MTVIKPSSRPRPRKNKNIKVNTYRTSAMDLSPGSVHEGIVYFKDGIFKVRLLGYEGHECILLDYLNYRQDTLDRLKERLVGRVIKTRVVRADGLYVDLRRFF
ncbi:m156R [Myxoma virus]|uniref:M156R n=4 Tax=Myxoma virus TaxID=10273 RepID=Q9Q8E9_MYXVL|nr:m156R [Myxoma virus]1JJG_A Chain A, M156R [Myxoma virus (strain Lausanne)]ACB28949.1 m156R [recombinant virus 6918VP60-T2]AAF15043.1 m156R [Myxoma virus]ACB28777.1 m156R [Myxoma virus]AFU77086.1 m156R [Myxoma virus]AFU77586.1 m156R [Myxoma virus]